MKGKTIVSLLSCALISSVAFAASAQTPGPTGTQGALLAGQNGHKGGFNIRAWFKAEKEILDSLSLTKAQQDQIDALDAKTRNDLKGVLKDTKGDKAQRQTKVHELSESYHKELFAILTKDQLKEFRAAMRKWHEEHKKQMASGSPNTAPGTKGSASTGGGH